MDAGFGFRGFNEDQVMSPNAQERSPFAPAVRERALESLRSRSMQIQDVDALVSTVSSDALAVSPLSLGGIACSTQRFSLATPPFTPRSDPQLNWFAGALHASLRRQATYRQEMFEQEESRAQDMLRFEQASSW
eukprot:3650308-Amphidinium_carterae.1